MKKIILLSIFTLFPHHSFAKDFLNKFRITHSDVSKSSAIKIKNLNFQNLLPGVGEFIQNEPQMHGEAKIFGAWKQSIIKPNGQLVYSAGNIMDDTSALTVDLRNAPFMRQSPDKVAKRVITGFEDASRTFPPVLEIRKNKTGRFERYWRYEFVTKNEDRLRYALISDFGQLLEEGELAWDGIDGKAIVYPKGPRFSDLEEKPLYGLTGDGTLNGAHLRVSSALSLNIISPDLLFMFPAEDKRFDLAQVYYTVEQSYRWLKTQLGVEMNRPVEIRVHVGEGGVSNAAFYHQNTIYLGTGDGVLYRDLLRDPSVLVHESIHALIDQYVGLPPDGEGGSFNEGFADLFAAFILDNPRLGEVSYLKAPYRRTLENNFRAYKDFNSGVYQNGSIIGATFWDIKSYLGAEKTPQLAFRTLVRLGKGAKFGDFTNALASACDNFLDEEKKAHVLLIAQNRGWH